MARLPQPGSDNGTWGAILNDFLSQAHNPDGTLKQLSQAQVQNLTADLSARVKTVDLAPVAVSGSYADLTNKPVIPDPSTLITDTDLDAKAAALVNNASSATSTALKAALGISASLQPPFASDYYYFAGGPHNVAAGNWLGRNALHLVWLPVPNQVVLSRIGIEVVTGISGGIMRLGVYANSNGLPGQLLVDAGTVDTSTTGFKELTISLAVRPPGVWVCGVSQASSEATIRVMVNLSLPVPTPTPSSNYVASLQAVAAIPGALPQSVTLGPTRDAGPRIFVKVA